MSTTHTPPAIIADNMSIIRIILAIILPPLSAYLEAGVTRHFWINVVLTVFGYFPGVGHALWLQFRK